MKVYNREVFLKMPPGVIYSCGEEWVLDGLYIKGQTISGVDFYCRRLNCHDAYDSIEYYKFLEQSLEDGISLGLNQAEHRDGSFDDNIRYLVFEEKDLIELAATFIGSVRYFRGFNV